MGSCFSNSSEGGKQNKGPPGIQGKGPQSYSQQGSAGLSVGHSIFVREQAGRFKDFYQLAERLGTGAFGEVRKCINRKTGHVRAVKVLLKSNIDSFDTQKLLYEIEILRQLVREADAQDHPNIVKLYQFFQDASRFYLVTELCSGGELFDEIHARQKFTERDAANVMRQVVSAVNYCHAKNIVHRDLKPENLLLDRAGSISSLKVIDFGTSSAFRKNQRMKEKFGTPYYIAPEVLRQDYNEKCDIWSCGVILYILLSGRPPFNGVTDKEILEKVKQGNYSMNGPEWLVVSADAKDIIKKMLTFDHKKRISAEQVLQHAWIQKKAVQKVDEQNMQNALTNLRNFRAEQKLQQATLTFIVSQLASKDQMQRLQEAFRQLDKNGDGVLSREELLEGYTKMLGDVGLAESEVEGIMRKADADGSGTIDYSEFVMACVNLKNLLNKEQLQYAFQQFDKDGSGSISKQELKTILGVGGNANIDEAIWDDIIKEVDENSDGEISFPEFERMMVKIVTT